MTRFISKGDIVEALKDYCFLVDTRLMAGAQTEEKRKLCELYGERIDAIDLDRGAKFDLIRLNSALLGNGGSIKNNVNEYVNRCNDPEQLAAQLKNLYEKLEIIADLKSQDNAEAIVSTISQANLTKFGIFLVVAIALAIGAIVMTVLGFVNIISEDVSDDTATVIGLIDLVLGLSFFIYERYTDMRKDVVRKQAKEYPAEFAQHYNNVITNTMLNSNVIGNNNKIGGVFVSIKNLVTVAASAMKQIKKFTVDDSENEE